MTIPSGCTHIYPENESDYNPQPMFFKIGLVFPYDPMVGNTAKCWYSFNNGKWVKDLGFCDRHKKMKTLKQYIESKQQKVES